MSIERTPEDIARFKADMAKIKKNRGAQHTPGSWEYHPESQLIETEIPNLRGEYAHICDFRLPLNHADGRLIAAAPALLGALKLCVARLEEYGDAKGGTALELARAALAKARAK